MDMDFYNGMDLLRCTKDELILYIIEMRKKLEAQQKEDGKLWDAISYLKRCDKIRDIWENCD